MVFVFILSFLAWLIQIRFQKEHAAVENRRQITGCEAARAVLDAMGQASASVEILESVPSSEALRSKELLLPEVLYHGKSIKDLARSVRAAHFFAAPKLWMTSGDFPEGAALWVPYAGLVSWGLLLLAVVFGENGVFFKAAEVFVMLFFALGLFSFLGEAENTEAALQAVKKAEFFEVDELVRFKKVMRGYRLGGFSVFFRALTFFCPGSKGSAPGDKVKRA